LSKIKNYRRRKCCSVCRSRVCVQINTPIRLSAVIYRVKQEIYNVYTFYIVMFKIENEILDRMRYWMRYDNC
jgi:hypothetical protein